MAEKRIERVRGCFASAAEDEPLFVLRSSDELAPAIVRLWAAMYEQQKRAAGTWDERRQEKAIEALALADRMESYRKRESWPGMLPPAN